MGDDPEDVGTQLDVDELLRRLHAGRLGERVRDYGEGRFCQAPGCATRLSIYNPQRHFALHEVQPVPRSRR